MPRIGVLLVAVAILTGCSGSGSSITDVSMSESNAALEDGVLQFGEYQQAVFAFRDCLAAGGFDLAALAVDPVTQVYSYAVPDAAVQDGLADLCYDNELALADEQWQTIYSPGAEQIDSERLERVRTCLTSAGVTGIDDAAGVTELLGIAQQQGVDPAPCLTPTED